MRSGIQRFSGPRLHVARKAASLTWDELAERTKTSRPMLLHWAAGRRRPSPAQLKALAAALVITTDALLDPLPQDPTLADLRRDANLSQADLAGRAGVARSTYAAVEAGRRKPDAAFISAVAGTLGLDEPTVAAAVGRRAPKLTVTQARHATLLSRLSPQLAARAPTAAWIVERLHQFAGLVGVDAELVLDAAEYQDRTGRPPDPSRAGEVFTGPAGARLDRPLLFLNLRVLPDRAEADKVLAHEIVHLRWPSYGHRQVAFTRAQELLDQVAPPTQS